MAPQKTLLGLVLGLGLFLLASATPERAEAQCCEPPPPTCCTPPAPPVCCTPPPPPPPPANPPCCTPGHGVKVPGVNVVVARMAGARLLPAAHDVTVGDALTLRCRLTLKASSTQVLFEQFLLTASGEPVARAAITCLCLSPAQGKIVPAPAALQATLAAAVNG